MCTVESVNAGLHRVCRSVQVAAPASELFGLVVDPHRHAELDGSGTVHGQVVGPTTLAAGQRFSVKMSWHRIPYRLSSTVTSVVPDRLVEWRHPMGHRWRWEFEALTPSTTRVTETFDYSGLGRLMSRLDLYRWLGFPRTNAAGIEATLEHLHDRYESRGQSNGRNTS